MSHQVIVNGYVVAEFDDLTDAKNEYAEQCHVHYAFGNWKINKVQLKSFGEIHGRNRRKNRNQQNARGRRGVYWNATLRLLQQTEEYRRRQVSQNSVQQSLDVS